ncbi:MAG: hypothetical protein H0X39_13635 [Actinobacteria bacterium]|nr:hypothetical protein [Actinomycetota bacterium]
MSERSTLITAIVSAARIWKLIPSPAAAFALSEAVRLYEAYEADQVAAYQAAQVGAL